MPGEFAAHERTVICWPSRHDLYGDHIGDARLAHAALAKTISAFEPVTMIANAQDAERARALRVRPVPQGRYDLGSTRQLERHR